MSAFFNGWVKSNYYYLVQSPSWWVEPARSQNRPSTRQPATLYWEHWGYWNLVAGLGGLLGGVGGGVGGGGGGGCWGGGGQGGEEPKAHRGRAARRRGTDTRLDRDA